jgi:hypothetical protein
MFAATFGTPSFFLSKFAFLVLGSGFLAIGFVLWLDLKEYCDVKAGEKKQRVGAIIADHIEPLVVQDVTSQDLEVIDTCLDKALLAFESLQRYTAEKDERIAHLTNASSPNELRDLESRLDESATVCEQLRAEVAERDERVDELEETVILQDIQIRRLMSRRKMNRVCSCQSRALEE